VNNRPKTGEMVALKEASIEHHSGPLPSGAEFERYEHVLPGTAERLVVMVESETQHRHQFEDKALAANIKFEGLGLIFAFITILIAMAITVVCAFLHQPLAFFVSGAVALPGLASVFMRKRK
jgi:uncharacterized membrane protein